MIHVCLSHDIDRIEKSYQYLTKPMRALKNGKFKLFFKLLWLAVSIRRPYWGFDEIMRIEDSYGVRSTCFFLNESIKPQWNIPKSWKLAFGRYDIHDKRIVHIIRELDSSGWEIGVHGSFLSSDNEDLLRQEKKTLEEIVGHDVIGIRQHYLNMSDKTFCIHQRCGFKYDSTWGLTDGIGFKEGKVCPFFPVQDSDYCEIPLTIMDSPFSETPDKWLRFEKIVDEIDCNNAYLVINYHNNNFSNSELLDYNRDYVHMIELLRKRGAQFLTMGEAYRQITAHRYSN